MSFSAGIVAAVGVSCAAGSALLTLGTVWCVRRARRIWGVQKAQQQVRQQQIKSESHEEKTRMVCKQLVDILELNILHKPVRRDKAREMLVHLQIRIRGYITGWVNSEGPFPLFDDDALAAITAAAGPDDLWARLPTMDRGARSDALVHMIARVLFPRMRTDCDLQTTLLPPSMLGTYQDIMTMPADDLAEVTRYSKRHGRLAGINLRHYWRTITSTWSAKVYRLPGLDDEKWMLTTEGKKIRAMTIGPGDARLPNVEALEELLRGLLEPFAATLLPEDITPEETAAGIGGQQCKAAKERLRAMTLAAAELALYCFAEPAVTEVYWPESGRPEVDMPPARLARTHLLLFGVRRVVDPDVKVSLPRMSVLKPGEKYDVLWKSTDTDSDAREYREMLHGDVIRNKAQGMKDWEDPEDEMPEIVREVQVDFGWIKEGEEGLRENPRRAVIAS